MVCYCKQKTAYEMRISDWSSDVCSSDLLAAPDRRHRRAARRNRDRIDVERDGDIGQRHHRMIGEIARTEQALFLGRRREEIDVAVGPRALAQPLCDLDRSEEHTSELQSLMRISYAVFCLKKKK